MKTLDISKKYMAIYQMACNYVDTIKNVGFVKEANELQTELGNINSSVVLGDITFGTNGLAISKVRSKNGPVAVCAVPQKNYEYGIDTVNKFIKRVESKYTTFVVAYNTCNTIRMGLNSNMPVKTLDEYVTKMIDVITDVMNTPTINEDVEAPFILKLFKVAYSVIKMEILLKLDSQLLLFMKSEPAYTIYINDLINEDIEKIDMSDDNNQIIIKIKAKLSELRQNGIMRNYLDLYLIEMIMLLEDDGTMNKKIGDIITEINNDILNGTDVIIRYDNKLRDMLNGVNNAKRDMNKTYRKLKNRIISLILSVTLVGGAACAIPGLAKYAEKHTGFDKCVETYSSLDGGHAYAINSYLASNGDSVSSVKIRIKVDSGEDGVITYREYDASSLNFDELMDYYTYAIEKYGVDAGDVYVERTDYKHDINNYGYMALFYLLLLFIIFIRQVASLSVYSDSWFDRIKPSSIKNAMSDYQHDKAAFLNKTKQLEDLVDEVLKRINANEELRKRFAELYEENKYLLDDSDALFARINDELELEKIEAVKKLTKSKEKNK